MMENKSVRTERRMTSELSKVQNGQANKGGMRGKVAWLLKKWPKNNNLRDFSREKPVEVVWKTRRCGSYSSGI